MKINVRPYREEDYGLICSWWDTFHEAAPLPGMMISDGTFVLEWNDQPVMTLTVFKTQSKEISYFEGFVRSPSLDTLNSKLLGSILWDHAYQYLKDNGYKRVLCFTDKSALVKRYENLGMSKHLGGLYALGKVF